MDHFPHKSPSHVGKYTIHGAYGYSKTLQKNLTKRFPLTGHGDSRAISGQSHSHAADLRPRMYWCWENGKLEPPKKYPAW